MSLASLLVHGSGRNCTFRKNQKNQKFILIVSVDLKPLAEEGPLGIAISRLASLERGIERRYLKHPLRNE